MSGGMRLCACLLNISEARNKSVVDAEVPLRRWRETLFPGLP